MSKDTDAPVGAMPTPRAAALARAIRAARGEMPQVDFVEHAGRPQSVVSDWERGKRTPSLDTICSLEESLGLPLGLLAARAGYFTAEAAAAADLVALPISSLTFEARAGALAAVCAADDLGLAVRVGSSGTGWLVEVLAPDCGDTAAGSAIEP